MLTKAQQDYIDEAFARVGKPSAALQLQIDQIRAAKTEAELTHIFSRDADVVRPKIEAELLCAVMLTKLAELNSSINAKSLKEEHRAVPNHIVKAENSIPQSKQKEFFNLIKGIGIIVLFFWVVVALFSKKHTGQAIEYTILSTTINGRYYEKEARPSDLNSDLVTFEDGARVSWADVNIRKMKVYPDELGITNSLQ